MSDWAFVLPFLCGTFWAAGGRPRGRWFRRLGVGISVSVAAFIYTGAAVVFWCIPLYWIVTSLGYGRQIKKKNWHIIALIGTSYGLACFPVAIAAHSGLIWSQASLSAIIFTGLTIAANTGEKRPHWAFVEGFTGIAATMIIPWMLV